jgi:late competence protein required for DNA uptake (superfamily II DNA/RNA helicase)
MSGKCCFNHLIGLPEKHGVKHNLYLYEYNLFAELMKDKPKSTDDIVNKQQHKHLAVIKATGFGITEFVLRWIAWMRVRNNDFKRERVCIVTGPNIALAITLIKRLKELFLNPDSNSQYHQLIFDSKETIIIINGCIIQAFPSHHLDAMRGLTNVAVVFQDEASFFETNQANDAIDVSQRYIAKSDPYLIVVSTPNKPGDMLHR